MPIKYSDDVTDRVEEDEDVDDNEQQNRKIFTKFPSNESSFFNN
jgi:hypothetical protein